MKSTGDAEGKGGVKVNKDQRKTNCSPLYEVRAQKNGC